MDLSTPINPLFPPRPLTTEKGELLQYRTHISSPNAKYDLYNPKNVAVQIQLYRWVTNIEYIPFVGIADLCDWLFADLYPDISKYQLGRTVMQTTRYSPCRLKAKTLEHNATAGYYFRNREDLQYGLEWMLSLWLPKVDLDIVNAETAQKTFDEITACDELDAKGLFVDPMDTREVRETLQPIPSWAYYWDRRKWEEELVVNRPRKKPSRLRGLG